MSNMSETINPEIDNTRAMSVYGSGDALDDFPVLKAFQQYIDAEQAKARKRLLALGVFFGTLMLAVIAIFVVLLVNVTNRNQQLNDRLVEFAMKDRPSASSPVVVQPPTDTSAILTLTSRLEEMQRKLSETQNKADKAVAEAEEKARQAKAAAEAVPKAPTPEELEIRRLKALLAAEKEKAAAEKDRRRQEELEAYRRKHYPELYETKSAPKKAKDAIDRILDELDDPAADAADDSGGFADELAPINYFDDIETERPSKEDRPSRTVAVPNGKGRVNWTIPD